MVCTVFEGISFGFYCEVLLGTSLGRKVERRERKKSDKTGKKVEDCVNGS
jgi:hypothetical protein